ncbi:glycosyltransferase family 4 protein [Flavobacteriaceae bacterium]|nr:glycosyltransferase family 4 protein [Flavobacteriaceae bacterium]
MKILQINTYVNSGSTGRIAEEIGMSILKQDWSSYIAYGRNTRPSKSILIKVANRLEISINGVLSRLFDNHGFGLKRGTNKLITEIKFIQPDIVHLHNIHGYYLNIDLLFSFLKESNIPVVWTLHDCWSYTGHCAYYSYVNCSKWKTECSSCPQITSYPSSILVDRSKKNFKLKKELFQSIPNLTIVTVSDWLKKEVKQSFLAQKNVKVINNGVNLDVFKITNSSVLSTKYNIKDKFVILGVANVWEKRKGLDYFIKLSKLLKEDEIIFLVGIDEKKQHTLPDNIISISRTENTEDLADLYSESNVYFNPTLEDNFPTTNLESLACGTPVVTFDTGGSPESISNDTGFIIPQGDVTKALISMRSIKIKGNTYYNLNCRTRAVSFYNKDDKFEEYIELYKKKLK